MAAKTSLDQLFVQFKWTALQEDHKIRRATAGDPTLLE